MIAIIGGGITGLSLAYFLSRRKLAVTVIEKEERLGGNASWINLGRYAVDGFYHLITGRDRHFLELVEGLGLNEQLFPIKTRMGFYQNGRIYPISSLKEFLNFTPLTISQRLRLGVAILRSKMTLNWRAIDNITAKQWLSQLAGPEVYQKLWLPVMHSKFGPATDEICAVDMWFRINRISRTQNRRPKENAYYFKGTLKTFFEALEKELLKRQVKIIKGVGVAGLKLLDAQLRAAVLTNQEECAADTFISTIPLPELIKILPQGHSAYTKKLKMVRYLNNISLVMRLKQRFSPYYQLNLGENGFPFTGIIGADAQYPPHDFGNSYILYVSKYFTQETDLWDKEAGSLLEYYLPYLKRIRPDFSRDWILDMAVTRKINVEAIHSLDYSKHIPDFKSPIANLYLLCSAQIYPEPTVLDAAVKYADMLVHKFFKTDEK